MQVTHIRRSIGGLGFLLVSLLAAGATPAAAQNPNGQTFGDWRVRCNTKVGAPSECQMYQNVVVKETGQPVLQAAVGYMPNVPIPVGAITLPLGIYLPPGLTMQIDNGQVYEMQIEICGRRGCHVRFSIDDKLLATFKGGNTAVIGFESGVRKPVKIPISLKGFTAALDQLH